MKDDDEGVWDYGAGSGGEDSGDKEVCEKKERVGEMHTGRMREENELE